MKCFNAILKRAEQRKGGSKKLFALLPDVQSEQVLRQLSDDRFLSQMSQCIFRAGFHWSIINKKWPEFEQAFHQFNPLTLIHKSPEAWDAYMHDRRIVRNWQKIHAVYKNALFVAEVAEQHGRFGSVIADWPVSDQVGLLLYLKKQGCRLGGNTGMYFLRFIGKDSFILSNEVIMVLQDCELDIHQQPTSQRDFKKIQDQFNSWHDETGLPYSHLSKIAAYSCGDNIIY